MLGTYFDLCDFVYYTYINIILYAGCISDLLDTYLKLHLWGFPIDKYDVHKYNI